MNYQNIYDLIIKKAKYRILWVSYYEKHHIKPRCLGGTNHKENIVILTAKEHFICHLLLAKIYGGKMVFAAKMMSNMKRYTSRTYSWIKKQISLLPAPALGYKHSEEAKRKIGEASKNVSNKTKLKRRETIGIFKHTDETKQKLREINTGKTHTDETKQKCRERMLGTILSEGTKKKISESLKGKAKPLMSEETKNKISKAHSGNPGHSQTEETKRKISESHIGKKHLEVSKQKMRESRKGKNRSEETKRKTSETLKGHTGHTKGMKWKKNKETGKREFYVP